MTDNAVSTLTVTKPEDLIALVPRLMGFRPSDSLVMVGVGDSGMHARVDLPSDPRGLPEMLDALLVPAVRHGLSSVVLLVYSDSPDFSDLTSQAARMGFEDSGVHVVDVLRVDDGWWFPLLAPTPTLRRTGRPYDDRTHPWVLDAVVGGAVIHESREALERALLTDQEHAVPVLDAVGELLLDRRKSATCAKSEGKWLRNFVRDHARLPVPELTPHKVARLLVGCGDPLVRDAVWTDLTRENAHAHRAMWFAVVPLATERLAAMPASYLALTSWLAGDGAMAWCAVDRCREIEPDNLLAESVAMLLTQAVAPAAWSHLSATLAEATG